MNSKEYRKVVNDIPFYGAIFILTKVPSWLDGDPRVSKGMEVIVLNDISVYLLGVGYATIGTSYLKFVRYAEVEEHIDGRLSIKDSNDC